jgi:hypothetical protein
VLAIVAAVQFLLAVLFWWRGTSQLTETIGPAAIGFLMLHAGACTPRLRVTFFCCATLFVFAYLVVDVQRLLAR